MKRFGIFILLLASLLSVQAFAQTGPDATVDDAADADPIEPVNRAMYGVNRTLDGVIVRPVTMVYRGVIPEQGREAVHNALNNLYLPVIFANSVLQGDPQNSFASFWRFVLNTTFGLGGIFDVAGEAGLKARPADFGQTLAVYGADPGPYVFLPILGPSNVRDALGRAGDSFADPVNYTTNAFLFAKWGFSAVDTRSQNMKLIDEVYKNSLDPYATFRSGYMQKRSAEIRKAMEARRKALEKLCENR